jgi:hypothetical protein
MIHAKGSERASITSANNRMKKGIILKNGGGELANQLWNYISIYAYGIEKNRSIKNPSFFEYHSYFNFIKDESVLTKFFSFWFKNFSGRRSSFRSKFWRKVYALYVWTLTLLNKKKIVSSENTKAEKVYLSPTQESIPDENSQTLYFTGWLFRNPLGLEKYRQNIVKAFAPEESITKKVTSIIRDLSNRYETIIGVHIRQADYAFFKDGKYLLTQERVRKVIDEYCVAKNIQVDKTIFLITSDGPVQENIFKGLNIHISKEKAVIDLFLLSSCDEILGSDSSFGAFASWYGNIPHIIMTKENMDWEYYKDKTTFFQNKYSTLAHY